MSRPRAPSRRRLIVAGAGLLAALAPASCTDGPRREDRAMRVELDIFSGRENPGWELDPEQSRAFVGRVRDLARRPGPAPEPPDGLGYRGLRVAVVGDEAAEFDELIVAGGVILARRGGATASALVDDGRSLERWLLRTGEDSLDPELYREAEAALPPE